MTSILARAVIAVALGRPEAPTLCAMADKEAAERLQEMRDFVNRLQSPRRPGVGILARTVRETGMDAVDQFGVWALGCLVWFILGYCAGRLASVHKTAR